MILVLLDPVAELPEAKDHKYDWALSVHANIGWHQVSFVRKMPWPLALCSACCVERIAVEANLYHRW